MACPALFLLSLSFLVACTVQQPAVRPFYCDSSDVGDNLKRPSIRRLFKNGNFLYFVLDDRVIFTRKIFENKRFGEPSIVVHHFYEQLTKELKLTDLDFSAYFNVIGHHHDVSVNRTVEFYGFAEAQNLFFTETALELGFKEVKGERKKLAALSSIRIEDVNKTLGQFLQEQRFLVYIDIDCDPDTYCFVARTTGIENSPNLVFNFFFVADKEEPLVWPGGGLDADKTAIVVPYVVYFNSINLRLRKGSVDRRFDAVLVAAEQALPKASDQMQQFHIVYIRDSTQATRLSSFILSADELFGCHTPFKNATRELKGIVYEPKTGHFYVFIRRFYLRFKRDLVREEFNFDESAYLDSGVLQFESEEAQRDVRFEIESPRLYVKTFPEVARFSPNDQTYELIGTNDGLMARFLEEGQLDLASCAGNTLVVESRFVFCFNRNNSYTLHYDLQKPTENAGGHKHYPVPSIFPAKTWKEKLMFTFNYENDSIVFMTDQQVHVLRIANFKVDMTELKYVPDENDPLPKKRNCLFDVKCEPPTSPPSTPIPPDLIVTDSSKLPLSASSTASSSTAASARPPLFTGKTTTLEPPGFVDRVRGQAKKTLEQVKDLKLPLLLFVGLLVAILLSIFHLTRKRDLRKDSPIEAKFYRSESSRSEIESREKRPPRSPVSKLFTEISALSKASKYQTATPARSQQSALPRNAFSSLFMNSSQASSMGKQTVRSSTPKGRTNRSQNSFLPASIYRFVSSMASGISSQSSAPASKLRTSDFHSSPFASKKLVSSGQQADSSSSQQMKQKK